MNDVNEKIKVVDTTLLSKEETEKIINAKTIIKGLLMALYDNKFSNFVLSSGFAYMVYAGIVEELYLVSLIYSFAFFRFADVKSAYKYIREILSFYKIKKDNITEKDLIEGEEIFNEIKSDNKINSLNK